MIEREERKKVRKKERKKAKTLENTQTNMFNGVPADLHQFIAASSRTPIPFPLSYSNSPSSSSSSLSLHHNHQASTNIFPTLDPFSIITTSSQQVQQPPHHILHSLQQQKNEDKEDNSNSNSNSSLVGMNLEIQKDPVWSQDELLALLRIRSSLENWFPELTWKHVSRRLEELGYKRSAEKCKEKFEEESRNFNDIIYNKNYRAVFSEFDDDHEEELNYHGQNPHDKVADEENKKMDEQPREEEDTRTEQVIANKSSSSDQDKEKSLMVEKLSEGNNYKKRKLLREKNFEMFKGFCEDIVKKMMAQQEEIHNKLLEDMVKRDEENVASEEAWKKQEIDRINKELEIRACEQAIACDRQEKIIKFLTKFLLSSSSEESEVVKHKVPNISTINPPTSSSLMLDQNPNPIQNSAPQNPSSNLAPTIITKMPTSSTIALAPQNHSSPITQTKSLSPTSTPIPNTSQKLIITSNIGKDDIGKRWPRDEVLALINLRCNQDKEGASARNISLWERISHGMLDLGFKRSAKRCKEKWENINKYFRKTKDTSKKRSLDSRTCPYFHQLSTLYNQGTLVAPSDGTENHPAFPENHSPATSENHGSSTDDSTLHVAQREKILVQVPAAFDFEF